MKTIIKGTVAMASVRHVNGPDTAMEMNLVVQTDMDDTDGVFRGNWFGAIPIAHNSMTCGDHPELENKHITITAEIT